jgi:hypothetical protein
MLGNGVSTVFERMIDPSYEMGYTIATSEAKRLRAPFFPFPAIPLAFEPGEKGDIIKKLICRPTPVAKGFTPGDGRVGQGTRGSGSSFPRAGGSHR